MTERAPHVIFGLRKTRRTAKSQENPIRKAGNCIETAGLKYDPSDNNSRGNQGKLRGEKKRETWL